MARRPSTNGGRLRSARLTALGRCWTAVCDVFTGVPAELGPVPERRGSGPASAATDDVGFGARLRAHLLASPARLAAAVVATVLGTAVLAQAGSLGAQPTSGADGDGGTAAADIPAPVPGDRASWLPVARAAAATCPGLPSSVLVAIGHLESSLGLQPVTSAAGAEGPMQFLPGTWAAYGVDGDRDGTSDVMNPVDAVYGAARLLCANGGGNPDRLATALWNYNHSDDYVRQVMSLARFIPAEA